MWANKGKLRKLSKTGKVTPFQIGRDTPIDIKPLTMDHENSSSDGDRQRSLEDSKPLPCESEKISTRENHQDLMETDEAVTNDSAVSLQNASVNISEQEALREGMNGSGTKFDIPSGFDEPVGGFLVTRP